jgi:uncharacterized FlaG/YvyC family protein
MMSERSIQPIKGVRASENSVPDRAVNGIREHTASSVERSARQMDIEKEFSKHMSNVSIHFNVDEETNRLVVIVTERDSGRVLRTIPASEFEKLRAGELLKLGA